MRLIPRSGPIINQQLDRAYPAPVYIPRRTARTARKPHVQAGRFRKKVENQASPARPSARPAEAQSLSKLRFRTARCLQNADALLASAARLRSPEPVAGTEVLRRDFAVTGTSLGDATMENERCEAGEKEEPRPHCQNSNALLFFYFAD